MVSLERLRQVLSTPSRRIELPDVPRAAVAAVFTDELDLLFIERARTADDPWSGHIAFPGGRAEPGDADLLHTAIRETREELGLDLSGAELLGELDEMSTVSGLPALVVRPWVFRVERLDPLRPNHEVARIHRVPLATLLADEGRQPFTFDLRGHPVTLARVVDPFAGGAFLWGMTLRMVDGLLDRLDGRGIGMARIRS